MTKTNDFRALVVLAAVTLAAALLVLVAAEKPAKAAFPGKNGLIVFTSDRDTPIDPNTGEPYKDAQGRPIISDELYAMGPDGSKPTRLTNTPAIEQWPALSPDGTKVAFQRWNAGEPFFPGSEIYRMDVEDKNEDGNGDTLTQLTKNSTWDSKPSWSPAGSQIAFQSFRDSDFEIYVMDAKDRDGDENGDRPLRLTTRPGFDGLPAISPTGDRIAFVSRGSIGRADNPTGDAEIYVMDLTLDAEGAITGASNPINLTNNLGDDAYPPSTSPATIIQRYWSQLAWSPDGSRIAFQQWEQDGNVDIHVVNTGGSGTQTNLTNTAATDERYPAWSPDGSKIAFWTGYLDPNAEIYVMNADGSGTPFNLTNNSNSEHPAGDIQPDWGRITRKQCDKDLFAGIAPQRYSIFEVLSFTSEDECRNAAEAAG